MVVVPAADAAGAAGAAQQHISMRELMDELLGIEPDGGLGPQLVWRLWQTQRLVELIEKKHGQKVCLNKLRSGIDGLLAHEDELTQSEDWRTLSEVTGEALSGLVQATQQPLPAGLQQLDDAQPRLALEAALGGLAAFRGDFRALQMYGRPAVAPSGPSDPAVDILILVCSPVAHPLWQATIESHAVAGCFERAGLCAAVQIGGDAEAPSSCTSLRTPPTPRLHTTLHPNTPLTHPRRGHHHHPYRRIRSCST